MNVIDEVSNAPKITERDGKTIVDVRGTDLDSDYITDGKRLRDEITAALVIPSRSTARDPKLADLKRIGYRNPNGSKLFSTKNSRGADADRFDRDVIKARRKLERDRKRDQRRKARR